jgi:predicted AlkP superfamily phosphohydrolase/phosphomutase
MSNEVKPRVLVFGLDGATFDVVKPLVAEGRLPNLGRLMDQGSHGVLRSTHLPITPSAWTSFATGRIPCDLCGRYIYTCVGREVLG